MEKSSKLYAGMRILKQILVSMIQKNANLIYGVVAIPIIIASGFILGILQTPPAEVATISILPVLSIAILYGVTIYYAQPLQTNLWQVYIRLAAAVALFSLGLSYTLYMIIAVSIIVILIKQSLLNTTYHQNYLLQKAFEWIGLSSIAVIVQYLIYTVAFNQVLPYQTLTPTNFVLISFSLMTGNFISVFIGSRVAEQSISQIMWDIQNKPAIIIKIFVPIFASSIALLSQNIDVLTFAIVIGFIVAQVVYNHQASIIKQESARQLNELSTLNTIAQSVSVHIELDDVLHSVYTEVNKLVDATVIFVAFYDDETEQLSYPLVMQDGKPATRHEHPLNNNMSSYAIRNKQALHIQQSETDRLADLNIEFDMAESKAYIGIPMMIGEKVIGILGLLNHQSSDILGTTNLNTLQSIANQAGLALRNATLYDHSTKLADNLSHINRSVQNVMFNLNHNKALEATVQTTLEVTSGDQVAIYLLDSQNKTSVHLAHSIGMSEAFQQKAEVYSQHLFTDSNGTFRHIQDVEILNNPHIKELARLANFSCFAEFPMRSGTTIIGYLVIYHHKPRHYSETEIELLEVLSSQVTVALDNAELLHTLAEYASEQAELVHLSTITSSSLEIERVISDVSQALSNMLNIEHVKIGLYMQERDYIQIYSTQDNGYLAIEEYELHYYPELNIDQKTTTSYPQVVFKSDTSVSEGLHNYLIENQYGMFTISPMIINGEVIGVILIADTQEQGFQENQHRLVEMATVQIAAQIHNAQIHTLTEEALVKRLEQLSLIEDIGQKISRSLDLDIIINNVLDAALRSTQADHASLALIKDEQTMTIKAHSLDGNQARIYSIERPRDAGVIGNVMQSGTMQSIDDNRTVSIYIPPSEGAKFLSSLAVPLTKGNIVIGVLNVESLRPNFFTDEHVGFIKSLTGHAIISIDNAKLLDDSKSQIAILSELRALALTASTTQSTDDIVYTVIETAIKMMNASGGILIPYDSEDNQLELQRTLGWIKLGSSLVQDVFFIPDSLLYQVLHSEQALFIENIAKNPLYQTYEQAQQVNYKSIVIIPVKRRNQVAELLCIIFKQAHVFNTQDANTIELLQVQAANHIEHVMLSEEIRESNVRMRAILDSTRDGIILLDSERRLQDANTSAEELLNVELSRYRNQDFASTLIGHSYSADNDANYTELIKTAKATYAEPGRNHIREYSLQSGGQLIYIREVSSPVWNASNQIVGRLLSLRDVSEERALEEFRSRLQSMIIHDLRGPLSAIISSMVLGKDILEDVDDPELVDDLSQLMEVAQESSSTLIEFVESMLDIGKLQRKTMNLTTEVVAIQELVETAYTSLMASFRQAEIQIVYDIPSNIPDVMVDERLIGRVLINLIQNALKYTPRGGEIRITAEKSLEREGFLQILVSDTGPGIPEKERDRIFSEFTMLDEKTQKKQRGPRGQGLGLTFCKLTVEEHGGTIAVADKGPLSGATFIFTIPMAI